MTTSVTLLGATGSIGRSTVEVLKSQGPSFRVEAVAGGRDVATLAATAIGLGARFAALADPNGLSALRDALAGTGIGCGAGEGAVIEAAERPVDIVVAGISGTAGVRPTHAAVKLGRKVAIANKECLVCAGYAFMRDASLAGSVLLPLDSEHNAIFQAMGGHRADDVEAMILTASGGPFRTWTKERIATASREEALAHPNWSMGAKITIDSATLMNKGLELIEAHHLFGVPPERLSVLVHSQSVVHGLVSFRDGSVVAGLAWPDMRVPIAHCLGYPARLETSARRLDLATIARLDFEAPDFERFPALKLAILAMRTGGAMPTVLNAANEIAVEAFLSGQLSFPGIPHLVEEAMEGLARRNSDAAPETVEDALALDQEARHVARDCLASAAKSAH